MILLCILAYEKCYASAYIFINVSFWGYLSTLPLLSFTLGIKAIRSRLSSRFPTRRDWNRLEHRATSFLFYFLLIKKWEKPLLFRNRIQRPFFVVRSEWLSVLFFIVIFVIVINTGDLLKKALLDDNELIMSYSSCFVFFLFRVPITAMTPWYLTGSLKRTFML